MDSIISRKPRVLVVDDEDAYRRMLERVLGARFEVQAASSAVDAMNRVGAGFIPDVAVCDIHMPGDDGFALTQKLLSKMPGLAVIFLTGFRQRDSFVRAMSLNAMFLEKNVDADEINAAVDRIVEEKRRQELQREAALADLRRMSEGEVRRVARELRGASDLQREMLPPPSALIGEFRIQAHCRGCSELSGDLYDYCPAGDDGRVAFLCADVMGHGVAPAMLTPLVKSAFRSAKNHHPTEVVERLRQLLVWVEPKEYFVAMFAAIADPREGTLTYICAGHPPAILLNASPPALLQSVGPPILGDFDPGQWSAVTVPFSRGDGLLVFTDGLIEAGAPEARFGQDRVRQSAAATGADRTRLIESIIEDLRSHTASRPINDDVTLLLLEFGAAR